MKYILMHKNIPVAEIELDDASGYIAAVGQVYAPEHTPIGIPVKKNTIECSFLNDCLINRLFAYCRTKLRQYFSL